MKFSRFPLDQLTGAVLGHSIRVEEVNFKKGRVLSEADVAQLHAVGVEKAVAAILESGDVPEDVAATRVTAAAMGQGVSSRAAFTGRCNIYADVSGMVVIDRARVDSINLFDESVTIATLEPYEKVAPRQMVATVKVIPFSAPEHVVDAAVKAAQNPSPLIKVVPFRAKKVGLILTQLRGTKDKVLLGTVKTVTNRIEALGSELIETRTIEHQEAEIAKALRQVLDQRCDMVLISGASAIVDRRDVVPMGIEIAGGHVDHLNKRKTFQSHYIGCKNLTKIFLKKLPLSFIQVGSSMEYGNAKSPQKENFKCKAKSVYGKAKLLSSIHLINLYKKKKFPSTILRLYQAYGPRQDLNRFIPITIMGCLKNEKFPCSEGNQSRDFLHVNDVVDAIIKSLINKNAKGQIINIGLGRPIKIRNIIEYLKKTLKGGHPLFGKIKLRKEEILKVYPDIKKAKNIIKWKPKIPFKKGLKSTIKFYYEQTN